jgi:hypothetical protein
MEAQQTLREVGTEVVNLTNFRVERPNPFSRLGFGTCRPRLDLDIMLSLYAPRAKNAKQ